MNNQKLNSNQTDICRWQKLLIMFDKCNSREELTVSELSLYLQQQHPRCAPEYNKIK